MDLVFAREDGVPIDPNALRKRFKKAVQETGISKYRWHDLRHMHASLLLKEDVHPKIVSERLGHSTVQLTLDRYSHVLPSLQASIAEKMDGWFGNVADAGSRPT